MLSVVISTAVFSIVPLSFIVLRVFVFAVVPGVEEALLAGRGRGTVHPAWRGLWRTLDWSRPHSPDNALAGKQVHVTQAKKVLGPGAVPDLRQ